MKRTSAATSHFSSPPASTPVSTWKREEEEERGKPKVDCVANPPSSSPFFPSAIQPPARRLEGREGAGKTTTSPSSSSSSSSPGEWRLLYTTTKRGGEWEEDRKKAPFLFLLPRSLRALLPLFPPSPPSLAFAPPPVLPLPLFRRLLPLFFCFADVSSAPRSHSCSSFAGDCPPLYPYIQPFFFSVLERPLPLPFPSLVRLSLSLGLFLLDRGGGGAMRTGAKKQIVTELSSLLLFFAVVKTRLASRDDFICIGREPIHASSSSSSFPLQNLPQERRAE